MTTLILLLDNLFHYKGYKFCVKKCKKDVLIGLESKRKCGICPSCGKRCSRVETDYERTVRDLDLAGHKCFLIVPQKKIHCKCGYRGLEQLEFLSKSRRVTKRMETYVASLSEKMSLKDVSKVTDLDWKTVRAIDKIYHYLFKKASRYFKIWFTLIYY